jgi:hypothetical protein
MKKLWKKENYTLIKNSSSKLYTNHYDGVGKKSIITKMVFICVMLKKKVKVISGGMQ